MLQAFLDELKRRNVHRVGAAYIVTVWLIIQVVETLFPIYELPDSALRWITTLLAVGFIPTLVLSWIFELTPEGILRDTGAPNAAPMGTKGLDRSIMVVLVLAVGYFTVDKFVLAEGREARMLDQARSEGRAEARLASFGEHSIAVLPFLDLSAAGDQAYMSDGIAEELLSLLTRIPELRVTSRSSSFYYRDKDVRVADIARELGVTNILEGSVRSAGNQLRVSVQLVEPGSGTQLWSQDYDGSLDDIFAIQDEIASAVVAGLRIELLGDVPTVNETDPETYTLYLQANHLRNTLDLAGAISLFEAVLERDPNYVPAIQGLSVAYLNAGVARLVPDGIGRSSLLAQRALAIDPECALCETLLGQVALFAGDLPGAIPHFERAFSLDPANPRVIGNATVLLHRLGRTEEAISILTSVEAVDPMNLAAPFNLALFHLALGRYDGAIAAARRVQELSPGMSMTQTMIGSALLFQGDAETALQTLLLEEDEAFSAPSLAMAYHALERFAESDEALARAIEADSEPVAIAQAYAYRGDADSALDWLRRGFESGRDNDTGDPSLDPAWGSLVDDPRWQSLLTEYGFATDQLAAMEFRISVPQ